MKIFNHLLSLDKNECDHIFEILEDLQDWIGGQLILFTEDGFGNL